MDRERVVCLLKMTAATVITVIMNLLQPWKQKFSQMYGVICFIFVHMIEKYNLLCLSVQMIHKDVAVTNGLEGVPIILETYSLNNNNDGGDVSRL